MRSADRPWRAVTVAAARLFRITARDRTRTPRNAVAHKLRDNGHAPQSEKRGGREEMPVVGINFGEALLGGAGEVEGIGRAEKGRGRSGKIDRLYSGDMDIGNGQPAQRSSDCVGVELGQQRLELGWRGHALADLTVGRGHKFGPPMKGAEKLIHRRRVSANFGAARLDALEFEEIVGVVVGGAHRAARSSEIIRVESVPPRKAPERRAASNSGCSRRVSQ